MFRVHRCLRTAFCPFSGPFQALGPVKANEFAFVLGSFVILDISPRQNANKFAFALGLFVSLARLWAFRPIGAVFTGQEHGSCPFSDYLFVIQGLDMDTKLMIFDLDGTLLDTIGDLAACCDHVLAARGLPLHTYEEYCGFVGNGVMRLVERALPEELRTPETVAAVRADFVAYYTEHIDRFTRPYEGIPELLRELVQRGVRLAVASNKFQIGTEKLVRIYFPSIRFDAVFGQRPGVPLKPDPQVVREILADTDAESGAVLYAGDSGVDMDTARAAGVRSVGVTWGFRDRAELYEHGADHVVDRPGEILELL
jgi:phosphoglycolate phosphatase